ncbi:hypothetical protein [Klebsiella pneumoniae]|uniref:hypothetical protein n=1 Tax=Klebsiella pneumoniae TaxID=573 RepID=UPI0034D284ED
MSKSAIKALNKANEILSSLNLTVGIPANWMVDTQARRQFRNADLLACLIINSAANALQCETADSLEDNLYDNMQQAIEGYIHSNLDCWNQKEWPESCRDVNAELARLAEMVEGQKRYNEREAAHAEALEVNAIVDNAVQVATCYSSLDSCTHNAICKAIDITRRSLLALNRYNPRFIVKMMISVTRQAKEARKAAAVRYQEMLARCAASDAGYNEIPF